MSNFAEKFGFHASPFEKYVAENEPSIEDYAVTPPYFEEVRKHTLSVTPYILFGFRVALLRKSPDGRTFPFPGRTYATTSVTGLPRAVKPFSTATRTWNSAT